MKEDFTEQILRDLAREAIKQQKALEFMFYVKDFMPGWEKKAKKIFLEELRRINAQR